MLPSLIKCTAYINDPEAPLDKFSPIILMSRNSDECGSFHSWHSQIFHSQLRISFDRFNGQISLQTIDDYLLACSIATATATVAPTMGLLPAQIKHIIPTPFINQTVLKVNIRFTSLQRLK
jgi:hypothetical protein